MRALRLFLVFVVLSLLTRWLALVLDVIDMDETAHIVGAWELLRGRVPYAEFVNNKPPLLYVYYALSQVLLGEGLRTVRALTVLVTVPLTALALSWAFAHARAGIVAALVYLVYGAAFIGHDMLAANTEILMLLPAAWAVAVAADERRVLRTGPMLLAGVLVGMAMLFRPQGALFAPPLAIAAACAAGRQRRLASAAAPVLALAAGVVVPLVVTWVVFERLGAAADLVYWVLTANLGYVDNPISGREALERMVSYFVPFLVVTAPLWWAAAGIRGHRHGRHHLVLGSTLILFALPAVIVGFRFYPHYFVQLYAPLAFLAAPVVEVWCRRPLSRAGTWFLGWSALMLLAFTVSTVVLYSGRVRVYREIDPVFTRVGERLRADACAGTGTLFVWGYAPVFYYHARLPAASRFVVLAQARLTSYVSGNLAVVRGEVDAQSAVVPAHWDWLMDDLERRRATYVIDTAPAGIFRWNQYPMRDYPRLQSYVDANFTLLDTIDRVRIYRRLGCEADR